MSEATMPKQEYDKQSVVIERAVPGDAGVICDVRDKAWIDAYPNEELGVTVEDIKVNAQGQHGEFLPRRIEYLKKEIEAEDGISQVTFVAKVDGNVRGVVAPRINDKGRHMLSMVYVLPQYQGKGIGGKLMQKALDWFGRDKDIFLEVVSYNQNVIDFYKRFGLEKTGAVVPEETNRPEYIKSLPQIEMVLKAKMD